MQMKQRQHRIHCARKGIENDYLEKYENMEDLSKGGTLVVNPAVAREQRKIELTRKEIATFKRLLKRDLKDKKYDPSDLKNKIKIMTAISGSLAKQEQSAYNETTQFSEHYQIIDLGTKITQVYSQLAVRMQMIHQIAFHSVDVWTRFNKTQSRWMGNCVMGPDNLPVYYIRMQKLGFELLIGQVYTSQQYRS